MDLADHIAQQHSVEEQARGKLLKEVDSKDAVPAPIPPPELFPELAGLEFDPNFPDDLVKDIDILLMTATDIELRGVLGYLNPLGGRKKIIKSFINSTWIYVGKYGGYSVVVGRSACAKSQQGGLNALLITNKIMKIYKPKYIIAIGVCFGMDQSKVQLGDVIVSDFIVDLSDFRKEPGSITARKPQPPAGTTLSSFFGNNSNLKIKCFQEENAKEVKVHCGPIASTSALVDDPKFKEELREARSDALAGEMEGAAIFSAARHAHHKPEAIVIKAVGDWGDGKKDECRGWKDFASHAAATYVHDSLKNAFLDSSSDSSSDASLYASPDIEEWLKEGRVDLTIKRVLMHGLPGSGKTCSQHLLLNEPPPKVDKSTPIACRAVKATRISVNDDRMERVDTKALLSSLAHDLKEAAAKQKKSPPEDHSTESKEKSSEAKTKSTDTTETEDPADDTEASKIRNDIVEAIPIAKAKLDTNWVYFVDSGGQTAFQELLPLFTRAASFNIITIDVSKGINEKLKQEYRINGESFSCDSDDSSEVSYTTNIEFLKDVLSSGAILQPYRAPQATGSEENTSTGSTTSPQYAEYFVLGTHKDKANPKVIEKYNNQLKELEFESEEKGYCIIPAVENSKIIYPLNTMLPRSPERENETKKLCRIIYNKVSGDKIRIPVRLFAFELTLLEKAKGHSFLPMDDVLVAGESLQMTEAQTKEALQYLHNVTIILYYPQDLPDVVFVDPHPILDVLSRLLVLVTYQIPREHLGHFVKETNLLKEDLKFRGLFTKAFLENLNGGEDFCKPDVIKLLLHLHIIIETDEQDEYFLPSALPPRPKTSPPPESDIDPLQIIWCSPVTNPENSREILPVPRGIFPLVVINLIKFRQLQFCFPSKFSQYLRYRDAMSFRVHYQDAHIGTVHIIKKDRCIEIYFETNDLKYCPLIREAVKEAIASSCKAININPDGFEFAFACPSSTNVCYRIVTDEDKKEVECSIKPPTNSGKEQHWSWFDKTQSSTQVSDDATQDNTAPAPTIADDGATNVVEAKKDAVPAPAPPPELFPELADLEFDRNFTDDLVKDINILLMTATDIELRGVLGHLEPLDGRRHIIKQFIKFTWVYIGRYGGHTVVVGKSANSREEQGGLDASATAQEIMTKFKPNYVIAIGICFGMDRNIVYLADVIVSSKILNLSNFRMEPGSVEPRKPDIPVGLTLSKIFSDPTHGFKKKHSTKENSKKVKVHSGLIVTSPVLVNDKKFKEELRSIRSQGPDLLAGEMEAAGIHSAAKRDAQRPEIIVIKAVGDWGDETKDKCRDWKPFASHAAATFVHHQLNIVAPKVLQ